MAQTGSRRERRQQARRLGVLTDAQVALGWFVILALAALVGTIYVSQASRIASTGRRVQIMQNDLEDIKRENASLERTIAESQSLERLQTEAARLGFTKALPESIEYLVIEDYPAADGGPSSQVAESVEVPAAPVETIGEALWLAVEENITHLMRGESGE